METPEQLTPILEDYAQQGWISIIGGCCLRGSHSRHCQKPSEKLPLHVPPKPISTRSSTQIGAVGATLTFVGETHECHRLTQVCAFAKAAYRSVEIARQQVDNGANIIDINFDEGMIDARK